MSMPATMKRCLNAGLPLRSAPMSMPAVVNNIAASECDEVQAQMKVVASITHDVYKVGGVIRLPYSIRFNFTALHVYTRPAAVGCET